MMCYINNFDFSNAYYFVKLIKYSIGSRKLERQRMTGEKTMTWKENDKSENSS